MLRLAKALWNDQAGFIVSAELVLISTVGVIGLVTGLTCLRNAVNSELTDVSCAIRSLDQTYCYTGFHSYKDRCRCKTKAVTAGSSNRPYIETEAELVPVIEGRLQPTAEQEPGQIISERVISERIISERVIGEPVPVECPPVSPILVPAAESSPTPAEQECPVPTPEPLPSPAN